MQTGDLSILANSRAGLAKKILVVDDNEIILKTITLKLRGAGYDVLTAMDGTDAVAMARTENPDLIILDITFPMDIGIPWDGFRIMEWFQRLDSTRATPIIVITSADDRKTRDRATASGAVAFFLKPVDHEALVRVVRATLGQ